MAHRCKLDKVIFLPCSSKRKDKHLHTTDEHRWQMVQMAIQDNDRYIADNYEMEQEAWNVYTEQTLTHFKEVYPDDEVYFIMGADLLEDIGAGKWVTVKLLCAITDL